MRTYNAISNFVRDEFVGGTNVVFVTRPRRLKVSRHWASDRSKLPFRNTGLSRSRVVLLTNEIRVVTTLMYINKIKTFPDKFEMYSGLVSCRFKIIKYAYNGITLYRYASRTKRYIKKSLFANLAYLGAWKNNDIFLPFNLRYSIFLRAFVRMFVPNIRPYRVNSINVRRVKFRHISFSFRVIWKLSNVIVRLIRQKVIVRPIRQIGDIYARLNMPNILTIANALAIAGGDACVRFIFVPRVLRDVREKSSSDLTNGQLYNLAFNSRNLKNPIFGQRWARFIFARYSYD